MGKKLDQILARCDQAIKQGSFVVARRLLGEISPRQLTKEGDRLRIGNLLRRLNDNKKGLALLAPLVRPEFYSAQSGKTINLEALSEYAIMLMRIGGVKEALRRLNDPLVLSFARQSQGNEFHLLAFARGLCLINQWRGEEAAIEFQDYLRGVLSPYQRLIGELNLANAFLTRIKVDSNVMTTIESCIFKAQENEQLRLLGNSYELRAQLKIRLDDLESAAQDLMLAERCLAKEKGLGLLLTHKWKAILDAKSSGDIAPLRKFRAKALEAGHWESVRAVDLEILKLKFDERLLGHLYLGSPLPAYREMLRELFGSAVENLNYRYGSEKGKVLDLASGKYGNRRALQPGRLPHQIVNLLFCDLYKPSSLAQMFGELYPDENYSTESPGRVQRIINRARTELDKCGVPLAISEDRQLYSVRLIRPMAVLLNVNNQTVSSFEVAWIEVANKYGIGATIRSKDLKMLLGFSTTKLGQWLNEARLKNRLQTVGEGVNSRHIRIA